MNEYRGEERRKDYIRMDDRLAEAEGKIDILNKELTILVTELPYVKCAIKELTTQIKIHEENATARQATNNVCRDERIRVSESVRWLWVFFSLFTLALLFLAFKK